MVAHLVFVAVGRSLERNKLTEAEKGAIENDREAFDAFIQQETPGLLQKFLDSRNTQNVTKAA